MKKLLKLILLLIASLSLVGCGLFTDGGGTLPQEVTLDFTADIEDYDVSVSKEGPFYTGDPLTITLDDYDENYVFVAFVDGETEAVLSDAESFMFVIEQDTVIHLVFEEIQATEHALTLESNLERAAFNLEVNTLHEPGTEVSLTVEDPEGYYPFIAWEDLDGNTISEAAAFVFTVESDKTLVARFDVDHVAEYELELVSNLDRAVFNRDAITTVQDGDTITIGVTDPEGEYPFKHWEDGDGNVISTEATFDVTIVETVYYRAVFELDYIPSYTLELDSNLETASFNLDLITVHEEGDTVQITVEDSEAYYPFVRFETVTGTLLSEEASFELTMNRNYHIIAIFDLDYVISFELTLNSNVSEAAFNYTSGEMIENGSTVELIVTQPYEDLVFIGWENEGGDIVSTEETYTFIMEENRSLFALFDTDVSGDLTLSVDTNIPEGDFLVSPRQYRYTAGEQVALTAMEIPGYRFEFWRDVDLDLPVGTNTSYAFTMQLNRSFEAVYLPEDEYELYLSTNTDATISRSEAGPYTADTVVTLSAPAVSDHEFKHWFDYFNNSVLSTEATYDHTVDKSRHVVAVYQTLSEPETMYETGFEGASKGAYAAGEVTANGRRWYFDDALVGSLDNDRKIGSQAVRIRDGYIETVFSAANIHEVSFLYATYGNDSNSTVHFQVSTNRSDWQTVASYNTTDSLNTAVISGTMITDETGYAAEQSLFIRISAPGSQRVNIDEFEIINRMMITPPLPYDVLADDVTFPNNSERLEMNLDDLTLYYSYGDEWDLDACNVVDTISGSDVDCLMYGDFTTDSLGEYDIILYAVDEEGRYVSQALTKVVFRDADLLDYDYSSEFDGYYDGISGLYGEALMEALRAILNDGVAIQTYGDARYILEDADRDPDNDDNVLLIYDRESVPKEWDWPTWEREHVWPNSRLGVERVGNSDRNIGSDLHNLRAITPSVNQARSNLMFNYEGMSGYYPGEDRGDVARIYFYMVTMWDHLVLGDNEPTGDTFTVAGAEHGYLSALIDFHYDDPVDGFEINRNEVIFSHQYNRNPFIDYPHLVELIWFDHQNIPLD